MKENSVFSNSQVQSSIVWLSAPLPYQCSILILSLMRFRGRKCARHSCNGLKDNRGMSLSAMSMWWSRNAGPEFCRVVNEADMATSDSMPLGGCCGDWVSRRNVLMAQISCGVVRQAARKGYQFLGKHTETQNS